jgi:hypothetical protein
MPIPPRDHRDDGCGPYAAVGLALLVALVATARKTRKTR